MTRGCPVLSLSGACSRGRMASFCSEIHGTLGRSFRVYYRVGCSNASVSLACRGNGLVHTMAHNSNRGKSSMASGMGAVQDVPLILRKSGCPRIFRVHKRVLVP